MATGDQADVVARLRAVLPRRWFPDDAPVLEALLAGLASPWTDLFSGVEFTALQTRIATATGFWLDGASVDYLIGFYRRRNETDSSFSFRVRREIVRPRNTRAAIIQVWQDLTGNTPAVFGPSKVNDTGSWGGAYFGYGVAGGWGSYALPFQSFVTGALGTPAGAGGVGTTENGLSGYGQPLGGYGAGTIAWGNGQPAQGAVTVTDVLAAVASVQPAGHIFWTQVTNSTPSLWGVSSYNSGSTWL